MPLGDHLEELRKRLTHALLGLVPIVVVALYFGKDLLAFLLEPLWAALKTQGAAAQALATGPLETFGAYVKISFIAAAVVGSPWILYQIWKFVAPGLYERERRFVYVLMPLSIVLTSVGVTFLYMVVMPLLLTFFLEFGAQVGAREVVTAPLPEGVSLPTIIMLDADPVAPPIGTHWINKTLHEHRYCVEVLGGTPVIYSESLRKSMGIRQEYRVTEYIGLLLSLILAFAVSFQTPVVVLLLGWAGVIDRVFLKKYRKYALFATAVVAALLTPGDVASMVLLWVPLYLLYELGGVLLRVLPASKIGGERRESPDAAA